MDWLDTPTRRRVQRVGMAWGRPSPSAATAGGEERGWQMARWTRLGEANEGPAPQRTASAGARARRPPVPGRWSDVYIDPSTRSTPPRQVRRKQRPAHWGRSAVARCRTDAGGPACARSCQTFRHGRLIHRSTQKPVGMTRTLIQYARRRMGGDPTCSGVRNNVSSLPSGWSAAVGSEEHEHITRTVTRLGQGDLLAVARAWPPRRPPRRPDGRGV